MIFRREPIHKKLARQARLDSEPAPEDAGNPEARGIWGLGGVHGIQRPRRWDVVAAAEVPGLAGDEVHFAALPNGDLVVDEDEQDGTVAALAEAVEARLQPPYRAEAVRRDGPLWGVAARRIEAVQLDAAGDELELVVHDGERTLSIDGEREFGSVPQLEEWGSRLGGSYVVRASRLDGRWFDVEGSRL